MCRTVEANRLLSVFSKPKVLPTRQRIKEIAGVVEMARRIEQGCSRLIYSTPEPRSSMTWPAPGENLKGKLR
jgi:hypothetical protein